MRFRVAARAGALVALFLSIALAVVAVVQFSRFEDIFVSLLKSRFGAVVSDLRQPIEAGLDLGLTLDALRNTQDLLDREKSRDSNILSIEIFERSGSVVFSTDRSFIGDLIGTRWLSEWRQADNGLWSLEEEDALVVGGPLVNSFDEVVGGIALRYSRNSMDQSIRQSALDFSWLAAAVVVGGGLAAFAVVSLLFRPINQELSPVAEEFYALTHAAPPTGLLSHDRPLLAEVADFAEKVREARALIDQTSEEIRQLDELG